MPRFDHHAFAAKWEGRVTSYRQSRKFSVAAVVGTGAALAWIAAAQAMTPSMQSAHRMADVQPVECALGAHIGPLGGCILGNDDDRRPVVIERHDSDEPPRDPATPDGCTSRSVTTTDGMGNSQTSC
jgi:hypothetical protein